MIDVIIVNFNCAHYLQQSLETLTKDRDENNPYFYYFITVVDNASTDGSQAMVESQFPDVKLIRCQENLGYSAAVNEGIRSTSLPVILLMNSDVIIKPNAVGALYRIWKRMDFPAIIGPMHYEEDGFPQQTWGGFPDAATELKRRQIDLASVKRESWAKRDMLKEACRTREVHWVSGSCMLFARTTVDDTGLWDQNFFLFFEDIDWCLRAKALGLSVIHTPEVQVTHAHGASVNADPDNAEIEYRFSQMYFTRKHLGTLAFWQWRIYLTGKNLWRWLIGGWSGFERGTSLTILKETWKTPGV